MGDVSFRVIQISDTHLFADTEGILLGVNTEESFQAVIDLLQREAGKIDLIIHSGDLSHDGKDAAYVRIANALKVFNVPVYCVPGNHDNVNVMTHVYPRGRISSDRHIVLKNWHLILLNSQIPGKVAGHLDLSQLQYLQHCLQAYPEHHAIVLFHHQPVPVGSRWLDKIGLQNANELWSILSRYRSMNTILFGHVHQEFEQVVQGIKCYSVPSTCIQFKRKQDYFGLEKLPPAYRWVELYPNGDLETGVCRSADYVGVFDKNAKGY
jgi:3',5'-cyclic-AMP phosphodiesterase